ncbi:hypothetical protein MYAM1_001644 [Malassezia yamatoensis]|uniref:Uncharacterized protein n=1 Tax=Malassezia yamatoensis TaxID=253288 RepID=A0AAJ5YS82_9BASI|nr:hypothetical protein MYAM1_001644 [Malassezia yamatoensis]
MSDKRKSPPLTGVEVVKRARQGEDRALIQKQSRTSSLSSSVISLQGAHSAEVLDVKFSPDGQFIAAGSADHTVSLWETYGGNRNIGILAGHSRAVSSVEWAASADEPTLISGSADSTLIVWNARTGQKLRRLRGHKGIVNSVACTRSGRPMVASGSDDGRVLLWDLDERHFVDALHFGYPITAVQFSEDGTQLFVGGVDNAIHVMDVASKQRQYSLRGHLDTIASLRLSRSGTHLLSSALDDTVRIWDVRPFAPEPQPGDSSSPRLYRTLTGAPSGFENLLIKAAWSSDGERVASGGADRTCTIWDVETGKILYKLPGHRGSCTAVDLHPLEPIVLSASTDRTLLLGEILPE